MSQTLVKRFAKEIGVPIESLLEQLNDAGVPVSGEDDYISDQQKLMLLSYLRKNPGASNGGDGSEKDAPKRITLSKNTNVTLEDIQGAEDLRELNQLLTRSMAKQQIQALIKDDRLDVVVNEIYNLASVSEVEQELLAAAMLGRLAAVARGRESRVIERVGELFTQEPLSIETLADGDEKVYAAAILRQIAPTWVQSYSLREAMLIDTADQARKELLSACLERHSEVAEWLKAIASSAELLKQINNPETFQRRVRRITGVMSDVLQSWRGDIGIDIGDRLAELFTSLFKRETAGLDRDVLYAALDNVISLLNRVIELRFSTALYGSTYSVVLEGKKLLGAGTWGRYLDQSKEILGTRVSLLESSLVLARQNRTDKGIMDVLLSTYTSRPQVSSSIYRHFKDAQDVDPGIASWWTSAGEVREGRRDIEQKVGNTEDQQIGALLIEVENSREIMEKLSRAVVPFLEISDPVLASTVNKAASNYQEMAQIARRLARMRKLSKTDLIGEILEYNPLEHEMQGGHKPGVRHVKVVRDGIKKEFNGKIKTLVKPWVEPE
ncbi:MAG: hypothetical protein R6X15_01245 [Pseudomonadota bacterium]